MTWELAWTKNITARTKTKVCTGQQKQGCWEWKEGLWLDVLGFLLHSVQFSFYHPKLESFRSITSLKQRDRQPHTLRSAQLTNLESPVYLTCMSLGCGRKHMEETHTAVERARVHHHRAALVKTSINEFIVSLFEPGIWVLSESWAKSDQKSKQQQKVRQRESAGREKWRCCMYS